MTASAASAEPVTGAPGVEPFAADRAWRLHPRVALRPEPFGALAYHYGNRRLTFLRSPDLVTLVEGLAEAPDARAAFDAAGIATARWPSFEKALRSLAAGEFLVPAEHDPTAPDTTVPDPPGLDGPATAPATDAADTPDPEDRP